MTATLPTLYVGQIFQSREEFDQYLHIYQDEQRQVFGIRSSVKNKADEWVSNNDWKELIYTCKFGGTYRSKGTGKYNTTTYKRDCSALIRLAASRQTDGNLVLKKLVEVHNHPGTEVCYEHLPEKRALNIEQQQELLELLEMGSSVKNVQDKAHATYGKEVNRTDLKNLRAKFRKPDHDSLEPVLHELTQNYGASASVLVDEENVFAGLYFSTAQMRRHLKDFPEIVLADGTYKLFNRNFTLMLLVVEDNYAETQIVGVGILASEKRPVLAAFFQAFRNDHEEPVDSIKCFMTDKDLTERSVIRDTFPHVELYICQFHVLRAIGREVSVKKMNITPDEMTKSLIILEKLVKCTSECRYLQYYEQLCNTAPIRVIEYYNRNWHNIKNEWTAFSMVYGNLGNLTNNRLESLNGKIKEEINLRNTFVDFVKSFFRFIRRRFEESDRRKIQQFLRIKTHSFAPDSDEGKYQQVLSPYGFELVLIEMTKAAKINFTRIDTEQNRGVMEYSDGRILTATTEVCTCFQITSLLLPACRHIFAIRLLNNLSLFIDSVKCNRWRKRDTDLVPNLSLLTRRVPSQENTEDSNTNAFSNEFSAALNKIKNVAKSLETKEEKMELLHDLNKLIFKFENATQKQIDSDFQQIPNATTDRIDELDASVANLSLLDAPNSDQLQQEKSEKFNELQQEDDIVDKQLPTTILKNVQLQAPEKMTSQSRKVLSCTLKIQKKKKPTAFHDKAPKDQASQVLKYFLSDATLIPSILEEERIIKKEDLISDLINVLPYFSFKHEEIVQLMEHYIDESGLSYLKKSFTDNDAIRYYCCRNCDNKILSKDNKINCSSCLSWWHLECSGRRRVTQKAWLCEECRN